MNRQLPFNEAQTWAGNIIKACFSDSAKNDKTTKNEFIEQIRDWYEQGYQDRKDNHKDLFDEMHQYLKGIAKDATECGSPLHALENLLTNIEQHLAEKEQPNQ